jgi:hypothetical protein
VGLELESIDPEKPAQHLHNGDYLRLSCLSIDLRRNSETEMKKFESSPSTCFGVLQRISDDDDDDDDDGDGDDGLTGTRHDFGRHRTARRNRSAFKLRVRDAPRTIVLSLYILCCLCCKQPPSGHQRYLSDMSTSTVRRLTCTPSMAESWLARSTLRLSELVTKATGSRVWPRSSTSLRNALTAAGIGTEPRAITPSMSKQMPNDGYRKFKHATLENADLRLRFHR